MLAKSGCVCVAVFSGHRESSFRASRHFDGRQLVPFATTSGLSTTTLDEQCVLVCGNGLRIDPMQHLSVAIAAPSDSSTAMTESRLPLHVVQLVQKLPSESIAGNLPIIFAPSMTSADLVAASTRIRVQVDHQASLQSRCTTNRPSSPPPRLYHSRPHPLHGNLQPRLRHGVI